jgi:hypothetical protein
LKIGLSRRKHLPVFKIGTVSYPLWEFKYVKRLEGMLSSLVLDDYAREGLTELWQFEKYYLPPFSLRNKTVLDVGACCGETAYFYLKNGASRVICVEPDHERAAIILKNKRRLCMNVEIINDVFRPEHILLHHDFLKCDIEGCETALLPLTEELEPTVVEVHNDALRKLFEEKGFRVILDPHNSLFLMANFSRKETVAFSLVEPVAPVALNYRNAPKF